MLRESDKIIVSYNSPLKVSETMNISLQIPNSYGFVDEAVAHFNRLNQLPGQDAKCDLIYNKEKSCDDYSVFEGSISFFSPGYRTFFIKVVINRVAMEIKYDYEKDEAVIDSFSNSNLHFWKLFVSFNSFETPKWINGGIMYQIFVDTFYSKDLPEKLKEKVVSWDSFPKWKPDEDGKYRNDQFYGGNLRGIIDKLDYIKSLGVTILYLTPIFKSGSSNRYDIDDYEAIDDLIGNWEDLHELHTKANKMGIRIIIDVVFNHSSRDNILFKRCPDVYSWDQKYVKPRCWWDYPNLVEFDKNSEYYIVLLTKWLMKYAPYVDGIRVDVADNLPDFILKYMKIVFTKYILGEVWKNAVTGDFREFLCGDELDGVMNYQFANFIYRYIIWGNGNNFKRKVEDVLKLYPKEVLDASPIFISSHDIPRPLSILMGEHMKEDDYRYENVWNMEDEDTWRNENGEFDTVKFRTWEYEHDKDVLKNKELGLKKLRITLFLQYTFPGMPSIFAGDEAGIVGYKDPFNRKPFPWGNIDKDFYNLYCNLGKFRTDYRYCFADSNNFQIIEIDDKKIIYRRGKMKFVVNRTGDEIYVEGFEVGKKVFSFDDIDKENIVPAYGAIAILES